MVRDTFPSPLPIYSSFSSVPFVLHPYISKKQGASWRGKESHFLLLSYHSLRLTSAHLLVRLTVITRSDDKSAELTWSPQMCWSHGPEYQTQGNLTEHRQGRWWRTSQQSHPHLLRTRKKNMYSHNVEGFYNSVHDASHSKWLSSPWISPCKGRSMNLNWGGSKLSPFIAVQTLLRGKVLMNLPLFY